ncbi:MAG: hypothetical protein E6P95_03195 [Candidatus Moraniibacteriota bacterium]|nr:MAG: hypothetical protein E6P95_03195 [Candidatus Moranbacteria bacterium]
MRFNIDNWIAKVQAQPEPVRMRYLIGCVALSMILVLGVWTLSVSEGLQAISTSSQTVTGSVQGILPKASSFSLESLLSGEKSLEDRKKEVSGELFFQNQLDAREKPNFNEEGFVPKTPTEEESASQSIR